MNTVFGYAPPPLSHKATVSMGLPSAQPTNFVSNLLVANTARGDLQTYGRRQPKKRNRQDDQEEEVLHLP